MTTEKMTVHKALAELKLLDDRITKAIQTNVYCLANKHSNNKVFGVELDEYIKTMQGGYDKVISLIARRKAIFSYKSEFVEVFNNVGRDDLIPPICRRQIGNRKISTNKAN